MTIWGLSEMNILVIGGRQAGGPGLLAGQSYVCQFTRRLRADGQQPVVHLVPPASLQEVGNWVRQRVVTTYDLILLQPDFGTLSLAEVRQQLSVLLGRLHAKRHEVILITPLPQRSRKFLRNKRRTLCIRTARNWDIPCFDTTDVVRSGEEYFQPGTGDDLSAVAHELLGSELHRVYAGLTDPEADLSGSVPHTKVPIWRRYFTRSW